MERSWMDLHVSQQQTMFTLTQGLLEIPIEMVKERLLDGLENGTELGILQCKKGKVAVDCHPFRISKNHRTIEYGPPNQLVGSVPITLIQSVSAGYQGNLKFKKSEKLPTECITLQLSKEEEKKKQQGGVGEQPEEEFLILIPKDEEDMNIWLDGLKILVEGTNTICRPQNLETIKHLQRVGKEVGIIQQERLSYVPPIPPPPSNFNFVT